MQKFQDAAIPVIKFRIPRRKGGAMGFFRGKQKYILLKSLDLREGDIILYHGKGILSRLIRYFNNSRVNHSGLYMGNGVVMEATSDGVEKTEFVGSISDSRYIVVMRLKNRPETLEGVLEKAGLYEEMDIRYEFEGILFLALISLVGRFYKKKRTAWLITKLLKQWFSLFLKNKTRQPMICSEFVYRCFHGVKSNGQDLTLVVDAMPMIRSVYTAGCASSIRDRRSLVVRALDAAEEDGGVIPGETEGCEDYLHQKEVMEKMEEFSRSFLKDYERELKIIRGETGETGNLLHSLMMTVPHFVTPRDLLESDSLYEVQKYFISDILRRVKPGDEGIK